MMEIDNYNGDEPELEAEERALQERLYEIMENEE